MSAGTFKFGNGTCSSIEVEPFAPICHKPDVPGSEALTLEVPAPVFAPVVPPQECACFTFAKGEAEVTVKTSSKRPLPKSKVAVEITQETDDCCSGAYKITPTFEIYIPEPPTPHLCLAETTIQIKAKYHDKDAENKTKTVESNAAAVSVTLDNGCPKYNFGEIMLDLTGMPTGAFGNGGSVFKTSDGDLYLDGTIDEDDDIWYGGGLGNLLTDDPDAVLCRGPKMRGYGTITGLSTSANSPVQNVTESFKLLKDDGTTEAVAWHSSRKATTTTDGVTTTTVGNGTITVDGKRGRTGLDYVGGNLSVVLPSGFQWHENGLALNLSHFFWEKSGLLSVMEETGTAALISPAPSSLKSTAPEVNGVTRASMNASGLAIYPRDTNSLYEPGLFVNDGNGLRRFGVDAKTTNSGTTETWNTDKLGTLEVYGHSGDFLFNYDGKMVLNDKYVANEEGSAKLAKANALSDFNFTTFARATDYTIPIVVAGYDYGGNDAPWITNGNGVRVTRNARIADGVDLLSHADGLYWELYNYLDSDAVNAWGSASGPDFIHAKTADILYDLLIVLGQVTSAWSTLGIVQAHFSRSGNLMAVDNDQNSQSVTRHYAASAPAPAS